MFCENCGANVPENSKFCTGCGTTVTDTAATAQTQQAFQSAAPVNSVPQPQPNYSQQQPYYNQAPGYGSAQKNCEPLGVGSYIGMFFLSAIPMAGFIMLLVWAFGGSVNLNKKNYARAILLMSLIVIGIWVVLLIIGLSIGGSILDDLYRL